MVLLLSACGSDTKETSKKDAISSVTGEEKGAKEENPVVEDESENKELNLEIADT